MGRRVPHRHREDPDEGPDLPAELEGARWWYLVAGPIFAVTATLLAGLVAVPLVVVLGPGLAGAVVFLWLVLGWGLALLAGLGLVVGLYADAELIRNVFDGWDPDPVRLVALGAAVPVVCLAASAAGVVLTAGASGGLLYGFAAGTGLGLVVSLYHLVRRRRRIGVP